MIDHLLSVLAVLLSLAGLALGFRKHGASRTQAQAAAHVELGERYARMAWAYARGQKDSVEPDKARKHARTAFVLADTSEDGSRDFTDGEVAFFIDALFPKDAE